MHADIALPPGEGRRGYQPALDGVRAAAVGGVLLFHGGRLRGGGHGVDVFFALSGYLITTLLLEERRRHGGISLRFFWARRALRLFPALAVLLVAMAVYAGVEQSSLARTTLGDIPWVALYVGNWAAAFWNQSLGLLFHTWSLSVEEQFYLIWPLVVIATFRLSRRPLPVLFGVALAGSALSLVDRFVVHPADVARTAGTDYRADQLLLGCALAILFEMVRPAQIPRLRRWADALVLPALLVLAIVALGIVIPKDIHDQIDALRLRLTVIGLASCVVIAHLVLRPAGAAARVFSWRPLVYIGRISYGVYLWHIPVFRILDLHVHASKPVMLLAKLAGTFLIASASYRFVEQPILRRKARFRPRSVPRVPSTRPA